MWAISDYMYASVLSNNISSVDSPAKTDIRPRVIGGTDARRGGLRPPAQRGSKPNHRSPWTPSREVGTSLRTAHSPLRLAILNLQRTGAYILPLSSAVIYSPFFA